MSDLIDRQAAIDVVLDRMNVEKHGRYAKPEEIQWALEKLPSAQPDLSAYSDKLWRSAYERGKKETEPERKQGKWINVNEEKWNVLEVLKCSACGEIDNRMYKTDSYCPNCGADMRRR